MGLRIKTNIASEAVQTNLKAVSQKADSALQQLSSGKRITKAADDAAGLAIATNLNAQTKGLRQAVRNANDGAAMVQVAEGGLNEVGNILVRLRELTVQAASDTVGDTERGFLDKEYQNLLQEVDRIAESTTFGKTNLLNGEGPDQMDFQVGINSGEFNQISYDSSATDAKASTLGVSGTGVSYKDDALDAIDSIDSAIQQVSGYRANLGAVQSRLQTSVSNIETQVLNQENARSGIEDADIAKASADLASASVIKAAGIATLSQTNNLPNASLRLIG